MFEVDEDSDVILAPSRPAPGAQAAAVDQPFGLDNTADEAGLKVPEKDTLRTMLYAAEPWRLNAPSTTPSMRRMVEERVNRTLRVVADWMLTCIEEHPEDELASVVLLELAESVRSQIVWPELEAFHALGELSRESQALERP